MRSIFLALPLLCAAVAQARELPLPIPPIPPAAGPTLAAPMPTETEFNQYRDPRHYSVTLFPEINHRTDPGAGLGYAPGTHYQLDNDRRFALPGVMLRVPLP